MSVWDFPGGKTTTASGDSTAAAAPRRVAAMGGSKLNMVGASLQPRPEMMGTSLGYSRCVGGTGVMKGCCMLGLQMVCVKVGWLLRCEHSRGQGAAQSSCTKVFAQLG